jgi:hypothetical protein
MSYGLWAPCGGAEGLLPCRRFAFPLLGASPREATPVDDIRFDRLARVLARSATSRRGVAARVALTVAAFAGMSADEVAAKCLPNGERCGRRSRTKTHSGIPCRFCCTGCAKRKRCACRGDGIGCNRPGQCCSGECVQGSCSSTCIGLTDSCDPESDLCCRSGAVCNDTPRSRGPVCCLPSGFPCDHSSACCSGMCDQGTRRCAALESRQAAA